MDQNTNSNNAATTNVPALTGGGQNPAIESVLASAATLTEIIQQETEYLRAADTKGFRSLYDKKAEVAQSYESKLQKLLAQKDQLQSAAPADKERLQEARKAMIEASRENLDALERTNTSLNRISERIMNLAREKAAKQSVSAYSNKGALYNNSKRPVSVGVIETA